MSCTSIAGEGDRAIGATLFQCKFGHAGQWNNVSAGALAGAAFGVMQDDVTRVNVCIGEAQQLGDALAASGQMKAQEGAAVVVAVLDVPPVRLQTCKID